MIVVTGGAGFIGSNLVAALERRGVPVVIADRLGRDEKWRNIAKRELHDLIPPERLFAFLDENAGRIEAVVHLGAISSTTETDADLIVENNFRLSLDLWRWCAGHRVRFLYASSAATYGDGATGFVDDGSAKGLARLRPLNAYGWSKHLFDRRVARAIQSDEPAPPQWAGLKFFNVYGPNEYHKGDMASVIARLCPQLVAGEPARLFKSYRPDIPDGGQSRDFVWVGDCVGILMWLLDEPGVSGLFNVGTGTPRSFHDLARATFAALGKAPDVTYVDMPDALRAKYQYFTAADMRKLYAAGFVGTFTTLEDGVRRYVEDHLTAEDRYI